MLLGGIRYIIPVIKAAHQQGYYVITADNVPDNVAHQYSDEYVNVSIVDKEAVLQVAEAKKIDGIMSFGVDPGVVSASYVQEKMGLHSFGPYQSVCILQNKDRFRAFLTDHGFNAPQAKGYSNFADALADKNSFHYPVIVKPTDSAGSKGVTRVNNPDELEKAIPLAFEKSLSKHIIIEDFLRPQGHPSDTDCLSVNGKLAFVSFNAQRFDRQAANPFTPSAYSWPSSFTPEQESYLTSEIQRLITLLDMKTAVFNIETRIGENGKPYIMEVSPRGGGNRLCEMLRQATNVDLITFITRYAVGDTNEKIQQKPYNGNWAEIILHANKKGKFQSLEVSDSFSGQIIETDLWVNKGDEVNPFHGANDTIGTMILKFNSQSDMHHALDNITSWLEIKVI